MKTLGPKYTKYPEHSTQSTVDAHRKSKGKKKEMYFINLTGMLYTDSLIINTFGHFINGKTISFEELLKENKLDKNLIELIHLFNPKNKLKITDSENMKIKKILQEWFSPLKNEWYPYLHYLKKRGEK